MGSQMNSLIITQARTAVTLVKYAIISLLLLDAFSQALNLNPFNVICHITECCNSQNINLNIRRLTHYSEKVYGQHLVLDIITTHLEAHFDDNYIPPKPLVLSFHGGTGTGKNYVTQFIVESIYDKGMNSKFVHYYHVSKRFPHQQRLEQYALDLQKEIEAAVSECGRSIFIFDEFDHMPKGLVDRIKVYLDFHENVEKIDYRKSVFFFLTNSGEDLINDFTIKHHHKGGQRDHIKLSDLEHYIAREAKVAVGGFHNSELIDKHLVTAYVPFLPLMKMHVKMCIKDEFQKRNIKRAPESWYQEIFNELHFVNGFSESGCKRIREKVGFMEIKKRHEL